jgi:hypothetical protein
VTDDHREAAAGGQRSEPDLSGEWGHVADALTALAASIAQATKPAVDADDTRRRLQALSEGLVALSARVAGEPATAAPDLGETMAFSVVAAPVREAHVAGFATLAAPEPESGESREVLPAVLAATAKFRRAAEESEAAEAEPAHEQLTMATEAVAAEVARPLAAPPAAEQPDLEGEVSIRDWLFPEEEPGQGGAESGELAVSTPAPTLVLAQEAPGAPRPAEGPAEETAGTAAPADVTDAVALPVEAGTAAPAETSAAAPLPLGLEAVRVAHERFLAERKAAEDSAAAALQKTHGAEGHVHRPPVSPPSDDDAPLW